MSRRLRISLDSGYNIPERDATSHASSVTPHAVVITSHIESKTSHTAAITARMHPFEHTAMSIEKAKPFFCQMTIS